VVEVAWKKQGNFTLNKGTTVVEFLLQNDVKSAV
jgi:hypothetical protein